MNKFLYIQLETRHEQKPNNVTAVHGRALCMESMALLSRCEPIGDDCEYLHVC